MAVVEHGWIRAAADALAFPRRRVIFPCVSAPDSGDSSFCQGRPGDKTDAGRTFVCTRCSAYCCALDEFDYLCKSNNQKIRPPLRLGAVAAASEAFLGDLLAKFMKNRTEMSVELQVVNREPLFGLVESRAVDIGFAEAPPIRKTLRLLAIRPNEYVVAAPCSKRYNKAALEKSLWLLRESGSGTRTRRRIFSRLWDIAASSCDWIISCDHPLHPRDPRRIFTAARHD